VGGAGGGTAAQKDQGRGRQRRWVNGTAIDLGPTIRRGPWGAEEPGRKTPTGCVERKNCDGAPGARGSGAGGPSVVRVPSM
jgi:hypothetical protein